MTFIFFIVLLTNQIICPDKRWTKSQNVQKMANCWTLFQGTAFPVGMHLDFIFVV